MQQPARRRTSHHDAFCRQFFSERRIDAGRYKGRLSSRQLVLDFALDGIRTDGHLGDAAFGNQLLELAVGNRVELVGGHPDPLQNKRAERRCSQDSEYNLLFS